jgi:peptidoglycan/LPS O-acetylase OafA/YrhL
VGRVHLFLLDAAVPIVAGGVAIVGVLVHGDPDTRPLALALALAAIVIPDRSPARQPWTLRVLESPAFVVVGVASYSLFLWHFPVILWLREQGLTAAGGWGALAFNLLLAAVVAGALSALTYRYVERPALRHKRRGRQTPAPAQDRLTTAPAAGTALASANEAAIRR